MISGNVRSVKEEGETIRLRVRSTGCEHYDECDVRVKKDKKRTDWFKNALGKTNISVWWQQNKLFATFGELSGFRFEKVGNSSNNSGI